MNIINTLLLTAFAVLFVVALPGAAMDGIQARGDPPSAFRTRFYFPIGPGGELRGVGGDDEVSTTIPLVPTGTRSWSDLTSLTTG
jgi:hypothetical protein